DHDGFRVRPVRSPRRRGPRAHAPPARWLQRLRIHGRRDPRRRRAQRHLAGRAVHQSAGAGGADQPDGAKAAVGTRAAEGHIGQLQRWFTGTKHIDEIEALTVELLKKLYAASYADHRLCASMIGNAAVYTALTEPGDIIMSIAQPFGGHSSNRPDGPAGARGLKIVDVPFDANELEVDLDAFRIVARTVRPKLVALGLSMALFPFPLREMKEIVGEWGGRLFFDGAHQLGLVAGGQYQDPLREGADVLTGSAGKTFSGPQSGIMIWNDPGLTEPLTHAVFPVWAATHQVNRVAALGYAAAELLAFGKTYMAQIVANAQALARALGERGIP